MKILNLELENIRNFSSLEIELDDLTVICGENAQGKSNVLDSIYYLTLTKSPKKGRERDVLKVGAKEGRIKGVFATEDKNDLEIEFLLGHKKVGKVNNVPAKLKEILGQAETVLFTVDDLEIVESPQKRRRFVNIFLSLLDKRYFYSLLEYQQSLKRRNKTLSLLKNRRSTPQEIDFWDEKIASLGASIIRKRKELISKLNNLLGESPTFFLSSPLRLKYNPKANTRDLLLKELRSNLERDIILEQTTVGPHRDLIKLEANKFDLEFFGSRGEKRAAIVELKRAEIELTKKEKNVVPILLLDDVFSELDERCRKNILNLVGNQQTILTAINPQEAGVKIRDAKVYELKNGGIIKK